MARILLVDPHRLVSQGVRAILEKERDLLVVGEAVDAAEALQMLAGQPVDLVVTEVDLAHMDGAQFTRAVKHYYPSVRVLALTTHAEEEWISAMMQARVDGYVLKSVSGSELVQSLRLVAQGQVLYPQLAKRLFAREIADPTKGVVEQLTKREAEILRLVALGETSREIAARLFLSAKTIDNHRARILEKLNARNKAEAVAFAIRLGYIALSPNERPGAPVALNPIRPTDEEHALAGARRRPPVAAFRAG